MPNKIKGFPCLALALLLSCVCLLQAQVTVTANINGTVTDSTGAVIQGATITATNAKTNVQNTATTDKDGVYNLRFLAIGTYTVLFHAQGFGDQVTQPFVLEVGQSALRNAKLTLEGASTQVTVQAELAPLLHTQDAVQSTVLDARAIANIPLYGRSIEDLTQFQPGAISTQPGGVGDEISVNGSRTQGNNYSLDGMEMNQNLDYGTAYNPNPDALEQIQMIAAVPSAEYGNAEGGSFIEVLKSGTNQFHGNAFFNLRNFLLDANSFGNKNTNVASSIVPRSPYTTDQFGGTLGGPIIRDKLFAFGDYQGYRTHTTSSGFTTVPTYDERGCSGGQIGQNCTGGAMADFSELLDPAVMCNEPNTPCTTSAGASRLVQLYDPFNNFAPYVNNKNVPINNPVAKYLFAHPELLPLPDTQFGNHNTPGYHNKSIITHNFNKSNQFDVKVDYKLSSKDSLSGRYSHFNAIGYSTPSLPINFNSESPNPINSGVFDEVHTFNSSIVNDFRVGYTRWQDLGAALIDPTGVFGTNGNNLLGIGPGGMAQPFAGFAQQGQNPGVNGSPHLINETKGGSEAMGGNANGGTNITLNTFQYGDTLTWLRGKHTLKGGFQLSRYQQNNFYPGNDGSLGGLYSSGVFTGNIISNTTDPRYPAAGLAAGDYVKGYSYADYLLDRLSYTSIGGVSGPAGMRQYRGGYFVNDDWKLLPNLTLNLGLRYEYNTQISEVNNKYVSLDPATQSAVIAGTSAAEAYCPGCARTLVHPFYGGILPRVGFSYGYTPRIVLRGGYSASTYMEGTGANLRMTTNPPFQSAFESNATAPTSGGDPGSYFQESQGFNHTAAGAPAAGGVFNVWDPHTRPAYVGSYTLGVEYQINNTSSVSLSYVGKQGQHLVTAGAGNQLHHPCFDPSYISPGNPTGINTDVGSVNSGSCLASDPAPFQGVAGLGYYGSVRYTASNAMENDNSMQVVVRQRLWHGLQYTFNFTWGHAMTNSTGFYQGDAYAQNVYNNHSEYGPMYTDARLAANWNMVYTLPVGRGRTFGRNMNRVLDEVVGGWNIAMTGIEQSGLPLYVGGAYANDYTNGAGTVYPNQYRPLKIVGKSRATWYGTDPSTQWCGLNPDGSAQDNGVCAYGQPGMGTFGSATPMSLRGTPNQLYNAAVNKDFTVWREHKLNFRADAKNVFNMSVLSDPNTDPTSGSFGNIDGVKSPNRQLQLTVSYHF